MTYEQHGFSLASTGFVICHEECPTGYKIEVKKCVVDDLPAGGIIGFWDLTYIIRPIKNLGWDGVFEWIDPAGYGNIEPGLPYKLRGTWFDGTKRA